MVATVRYEIEDVLQMLRRYFRCISVTNSGDVTLLLSRATAYEEALDGALYTYVENCSVELMLDTYDKELEIRVRLLKVG